MKRIVAGLCCCLFAFVCFGQADRVAVVTADDGMRLQVNGEDLMIHGMNWDYIPIGSNYSYNLWTKPDEFIEAALESEMLLLKNMGVNTIRQYTGVPSKWITYIYDQYGIYTMLNHAFGRYGMTLENKWVAKTDYAKKATRTQLLAEVKTLAENYQNTRGLLLFLLGNENNYGLFWEGAETSDIPEVDRHSTKQARAMYTLFNEAAIEMKKIDSNHPVAMCNGDLLFLDIIAQSCKNIDIFGANIYRGMSFGDAFQRVKNELNMPIMFTEFGADAFHTAKQKEDQLSQAKYLLGNWKEIYENAAGFGKAQNSIGGFTFQFSDGWWKYGQTKNLDIHDKHASWKNEGYANDLSADGNNMNEEWFGICAKGPADEQGLYKLNPRLAYYALKKVHRLDVYAASTSITSIDQHFSKIDLKHVYEKPERKLIKMK